MAVERAENKTERMRARAGAIDALAAEGVLDDPTLPSDSLDAELRKISTSQSVETELAAMKRQLGPGSQPQLRSGS
jgi:phage shock protein A